MYLSPCCAQMLMVLIIVPGLKRRFTLALILLISLPARGLVIDPFLFRIFVFMALSHRGEWIPSLTLVEIARSY